MAEPQLTPQGPVRRFEASEWRKIIARYTGADAVRSLRQVIVTLGGLAFALWFAHWLMTGPMPWTAFLVMPLIVGMLTRTFIIMHDCSHGSFLPWSTGNDAVGFITGVITFAVRAVAS